MLTSNTYGYRKLPDKSLAIIEEEAQVKRKMYELCAGGLGSRCIARILREEGVQKRNGNFFTDSDIRRMIRNPVNKGTVVMNRKHYDFDTRQVIKNPQEQFYIYENRIPAIVSEKLWKAANEEIDKRKKTVGNQERTARCFGVNPGKHVFSGKLVCGLCGAPFYRTTRKGKKHKIHEWKCKIYLEQGRKKEEKPGGCANIHLEEEKLFLLLERSGAVSYTHLDVYKRQVYYGFGFLTGSAVFFLIAAFRLDYYTKRLPYYILSVQDVYKRQSAPR